MKCEPLPLTRRQRQIARLTCFGMTIRQIATVLAISPETVKRYQTQAYRRLDLSGNVGNPKTALAVMVWREAVGGANCRRRTAPHDPGDGFSRVRGGPSVHHDQRSAALRGD